MITNYDNKLVNKLMKNELNSKKKDEKFVSTKRISTQKKN